jgi:hypothetical protein
VILIESGRDVLQIPPTVAKTVIARAMLRSSMQRKRPDVTRAIVDLVVDRVWNAFITGPSGSVPVLADLTNDELLRNLRILAVFICPAPEDHLEVREHALKPLGDDAKHILTEETKARLATMFREWTTAAVPSGG